MTALQIFKSTGTMVPIGKRLLTSKGGYRDDDFAYCICDDGTQYNIKVISAVNPREYSVPYSPETTVTTLESAILYNEWRARVIASKKSQGGTTS
jgi:hypothetical protein